MFAKALGAPSAMEALLPFLIMVGVMWAMLIRPQQRRVRQHMELVSTLAAGDEVITTGGVVGTIASVVDDIVTLEVAPGTSIRVLRSSVQTRIAGFGEDPADDDELDDDDGFIDDSLDDDDIDDEDLFDEGQFDAEPVAEPPTSEVPQSDVSYIPPPPSDPPTTPPTTGEKT